MQHPPSTTMAVILALCTPTVFSSILEITPAQLIQKTAHAVVPILSFSFNHHPQQYWKPYQHFFSKSGWTHFQSALKKSGNIKTILNESLSTQIRLAPTGSAYPLNTAHTRWQVALTAQMTYASEKWATTRPIHIDIQLTTQQTHPIQIHSIRVTEYGTPQYTRLQPRGCGLRQYP